MCVQLVVESSTQNYTHLKFGLGSMLTWNHNYSWHPTWLILESRRLRWKNCTLAYRSAVSESPWSPLNSQILKGPLINYQELPPQMSVSKATPTGWTLTYVCRCGMIVNYMHRVISTMHGREVYMHTHVHYQEVPLRCQYPRQQHMEHMTLYNVM